MDGPRLRTGGPPTWGDVPAEASGAAAGGSLRWGLDQMPPLSVRCQFLIRLVPHPRGVACPSLNSPAVTGAAVGSRSHRF